MFERSYTTSKGQSVQFCPARRCIFLLDDYSADLGDDVKRAFYNKEYLLRIIPGGITDNLKEFNTDLHHPVKTYCRTLEMELMLEKLRRNSKSIPSPSREETMKMFDVLWTKVCAEIDTASVFKKNVITLNLDGSENHLASQKLLSLVGDDMFQFREELLISDLPTSIHALGNIMEPPVEVRRDWGANTAISPEEGMELIDGEDGDLEDLQRELQMIVDSKKEIDLMTETVDGPDADVMDATKTKKWYF